VSKAIPKAAEGGVRIHVIGTPADAVEGPAETFRDGLPAAVGLPPVGTVVGVAVELDR